ncbi:MAG: hypothetical protein RL233_1491 [Bacteroidota bacterium]
MTEFPIVPGRGLTTHSATQVRWDFMDKLDIDITDIKNHQINLKSIQNNIESFIGSTEIPLGLVGPLLFQEEDKEELIYCPVGTLEGALVYSMNRGAKVICKSGGYRSEVKWQRMQRSPMFYLESHENAHILAQWIASHFDDIKQTAEGYSNHAKLIELNTEISDKIINADFIYQTGDASGQNMTTTCTWHALLFIAKEFSQAYPNIALDYIIEGNGSSDKKVSQRNIEYGRGIHVTASCEIPRQVIQDVLRTTPEKILRYYHPSTELTKKKGMVGFNVNVANAIAAIFVATGQDLACIHESSTGIIHFEALGDPKNPEGVKLTLTLPNLVIGTVGGGTHVAKQSEALKMIQCLGPGKVQRFAKIIAGFALGLEISTYGAIMSGEFAKAHEKLGRNKPVNWFTRSDITVDFLKDTLIHLPNALDINHIEWFNDHGVDNGIITNITSKISNKPIGFLPIKLGFTNGDDASILIKSKALDSDVIKGMHLISASIDTRLSDLISEFQLHLEFHNSHLKEILVYDHLQRKGFSSMPVFYGQWIQPQRDIYLIFQEWIDHQQLDLVNAENNTDAWREEIIWKCLNDIARAHELLADIDPKPFAHFQPEKSLPLYHKLMDILIHECADPSQQNTLSELKESLFKQATESDALDYQKTIIHNDFNPRNVLIRRGGIPCFYDWELAVIDFPQRDILEFLSFVLPEDFNEDDLWKYLKQHFKTMQQGISNPSFDWKSYLAASKIALQTYICCRVSFYEVSGIVAKYDFSQRILSVSLRMLHCIDLEFSKI